jgi:hypothetical protein
MLKAKSHNNGESDYWSNQQVSSNQYNLYYNNGNIGIGTPEALSLVHVDGNTSINYNNTAPNNGLILDGNLGIGTNAPLSKVHVIGDVKTDFIKLNNTDLQLYKDTSSNMGVVQTSTGALQLYGKNNQGITISSNGNVGIGTNNPQAKLDINGDMYASDHVIQMITIAYTKRAIYAMSKDNVVNAIDVLNLSIKPQMSNSKILLQWMINGESVFNVVFVVLRDGTPIGFNTIHGNVYYSGIAAGHYDFNDQSSTQSNYYVSYIDTPNTTSTVVYGIAIKSTATLNLGEPFYLNRTVRSTGGDNDENTISNGIAWEIAV